MDRRAPAAPWTTLEIDADGLPDDALTRMPALRKLIVRAAQPVSAALLAGAPGLASLMLWGQTTELTPEMLAPLPALRQLAIRNSGVPPHPDLAAPSPSRRDKRRREATAVHHHALIRWRWG